MKSRALYLTATTLTALATPLLPAAPAHAYYSCDFHFNGGLPYVESGAVVVTGWADCVPTPESFQLSLTLEFHPRGGSWQVRAADHFTGIPNPRLNAGVYDLNCTPGLWRGVASMWFTVDNQDRSMVRDTPETIITC
ncbi:hypothetical protein IU501_34605 [Nocardia otitidiscaviarum]|uniref:hypothetical protein n=1 Tax=Nocardia otitidiscaviarum TaxID=1823 RepID=UPI0018955664|nr:hypothetical protein [Nocardia otitidiscaviarum]MBF6138102.1 hypothetical protein [Nocardia otitidiscaviarum]